MCSRRDRMDRMVLGARFRSGSFQLTPSAEQRSPSPRLEPNELPPSDGADREGGVGSVLPPRTRHLHRQPVVSVANNRPHSFTPVGERSPFLVITQANEGHHVDGRGARFHFRHAPSPQPVAPEQLRTQHRHQTKPNPSSASFSAVRRSPALGSRRDRASVPVPGNGVQADRPGRGLFLHRGTTMASTFRRVTARGR